MCIRDSFVADQEEADRLNKIGYQPWGQLIPGDVVYKDLDRNGVVTSLSFFLDINQ